MVLIIKSGLVTDTTYKRFVDNYTIKPRVPGPIQNDGSNYGVSTLAVLASNWGIQLNYPSNVLLIRALFQTDWVPSRITLGQQSPSPAAQHEK